MVKDTTKESKESKVSYHKKPENMTVDEWQRELRKAFVKDKKQEFVVKYLDGEHPVFADYTVQNLSSGTSYKVALRSRESGPNFCTCLDFKTNMLGTCKHIEVVLYYINKDKKLVSLLNENYRPSYSSIYLKYGSARAVMFRIGINNAEKYEELARKYCDKQYRLLPSTFNRIDEFLKAVEKISSDFRSYPDALDFIITAREDRARCALVSRKIASRKEKFFASFLKVPLYSFQQEGIIFAVRAGRCLIADDMGLGKTIQAVGVAELLRKEFGTSKVLIVCPTSLKYQWQTEIARFSDSKAQVMEGSALDRWKIYGAGSVENYYTVTSYNVIEADLKAINQAEFDLVILDEAQRIKNWQTKTARAVKRIVSRYAVVLTGTPIENKLEELYSIIQFIDPYKMGPLYRFLEEHQMRDKTGKVVGYRELNKIQTLLSDVVIRRTRSEVLKQLPGRTDKNLFVPLTKEQDDIHQDYAQEVSKLVNKWKRFGYLDEKDRQKLLISLNCMRMVSDSTFILDQETRFDTKIEELMSILENLLMAADQKIVVFSQWERMTRLVGKELENRRVGFTHLHGGVPSKKRKALLDEFSNNTDCRVFLSTDAGGVGLNLQCASAIINLDLPWNPAVLEQRIGRIYRHGQKRNVSVINLVSKGSIEERMLDLLKFKASLFAGALDGGADEIFMGEDKFKRFMGQVEKITAVPMRNEPITLSETDAQKDASEKKPTQQSMPLEEKVAQTVPTELFASAAKLFGNLSAVLADKQNLEKVTATFVGKDKVTGKQFLKIPLENEQAVKNAVDAVSNLLSVFLPRT
ncbi:MAG: DEAD/DEAH box helicase [bacterium]|nr:DEAD/DEAH box helicase [bacterium]